LGGNAETAQAIGYGHIVECFFKDGPQLGGRLRGITYRPKILGRNTGGLDLKCISGSDVDSAADAINKGRAMPADLQYTPRQDVNLTKTGKLKIKEFIELIKKSPHFATFSGPVLAGVISNAKSESQFNQLAAGDSVQFYTKAFNEGKVSRKRMQHVLSRNINGKCSWGYWQLNICPDDGSGKQLADSKGIDLTTPEGKKAWVDLMKDNEGQFEWVASKISKVLSQGITGTDAYQAGYDITVKFERPVKKEEKGIKRGNYALAIYKEFKDILDAPSKVPGAGDIDLGSGYYEEMSTGRKYYFDDQGNKVYGS
jgi:hypothetical protein